MKTAISIPDPVFTAADHLARQMGLSRSDLFSQAVRAFLQEHSQDGITEALNRVYGSDCDQARLDPLLAGMQAGTLGDRPW